MKPKLSLSEMKDESGGSVRYRAESIAKDIALQISRDIEQSGTFDTLYKAMPSPRLILYFQFLIKEEIFPVVCRGIEIEWRRQYDKTMTGGEDSVIVPEEGLFPALKKYWTIKPAPLEMIPPWRYYAARKELALKELIKRLRHVAAGIIHRCEDLIPSVKAPIKVAPDGMIACYHNEGIDNVKRSDLNWFPGSGISPERILIYFDSIDFRTDKPVAREAIEDIARRGFSWVVLKRGVVEKGDDHYWSPGSFKCVTFPRKSGSRLEDWARDKSRELVRTVAYWRSFYEKFNVRVNYTSGEAVAENIAQVIAFDLASGAPGALVGKQRSEFFSLHSDDIGYYPKHVFFIWNERSASVLERNYDRSEQFVISGYPYAYPPRNPEDSGARNCAGIRNSGAKFVTALFDNMHGTLRSYSSEQMRRFFEKFLNMVIDDPEFGLLIKSKKPAVLDRLPELTGLLERARSTGRCAVLNSPELKTSLAVSVAMHADISVGIGISSAIMEAAAAGFRGVLYDVQTIPSHEFYIWGNRRLIFSDIDELAASLARYKTDPKAVSSFGDWSAHIKEVDYFHDGRGYARMGQYIGLVFRGLCELNDRARALEFARKRYTEKWGRETVKEF